ncbi:hypothetical protein UFOVP172_46 [uncultured Caudovirales phage]|uniref:Uncharacterized protein n=1 Tax=uncultured Caudovirales phage TaxID=2100421 RepID=A0A6J7WBQ3_9CAUD|nr:hypothetical protein UFOVP172_46 [uncultured Caudovirales phage]
MDYEALAKQFGGEAAPAQATDYAAIAKQFGGETSTANGMPSERVTPWSDVGAGFVKTFVPSVVKMGKGVVQGLMHPIETAETLKDLVGGATLKLLPESIVAKLSEYKPEAVQAAMDKANAVGGEYAKYGSLEGIKQKLMTDPASVLADLSMLAGGGGAVLKGAALPAKAAGATTLAGGLREAGSILNTAGTVTNPLYLPVKGLELGGKVLGYMGQGAYNVVAPMTKSGAEGVKARGYMNALNNDPAKIDAAINMLRQGAPIEQVAVDLNSSGLAAFARSSRDANTVIRDLYNARQASIASQQSNALSGAQADLNALNQANLPASTATVSAPRNAVNQSLAADAAAIEAKRQAALANVANVSQVDTGAQLAKANEQILENTRKTVTGPAYQAAFEAAPKATIDLTNLSGVAKGQLGDLLTKLEGLAPNAAALLREFGPREKVVNMGEGATAKVNVSAAPVTLEDAHKIRQAINIDRAALKGSTDSAANITRANLNELYTAVNKAIETGVPAEALAKFNTANDLFKTRIVDIHRTGAPANLSRTSTLNEPMLKPGEIVSTAMSSEGNARQFVKLYSQDPAAMQTLKTGIEDLYRREVLKPGASENAHAAFMAKNADQIATFDKAGMGVQQRLDRISGDMRAINAENAALKETAQNLKFGDVAALRNKIVTDPIVADAALQRMNPAARASLARGVMDDAAKNPAKMLDHLEANEAGIMRVLRANDPKSAARVFADAKESAALYKQVEAVGKKLDAPLTPQQTSANLTQMTQGLPEVRAVVEQIQRELETGAKFETLAAQGKAAKGGAGKLVSSEIGTTPTGFMGHAWTIANLVTNRLKGRIDSRLAAEIGSELANSSTAAAALEQAASRTAKSDFRARVVAKPINALTSGLKSPFGPAVVNNLAPTSETRNNLRP